MSSHANADVRMKGFRSRATVEDAHAWLDRQLQARGQQRVQQLPITAAAGRVLAEDVVSGQDVPQFRRAMMDGFAVKAADTSGASGYNRLPLAEVGASWPGRPFNQPLSAGQAVRVMTGAPIPEGADAVLPVEYCQFETDAADATGSVDALTEVPPGKHVGRIGEDVRAGQTVLTRGRRLRPQDLGVLSSIGAAEVRVVAAPRVTIVVTGNELVSAGRPPSPFKIADANGPMLAALITRDGGIPLHLGLIPDQPEAIGQAIEHEADVVLVSGGSSCGEEDHAPVILAARGTLDIHGVAMRPSSPTGMGVLGGRLVFLLPGNPVSCLCAYDFFAGRAIRVLAGLDAAWPYRSRRARLSAKLVSQVGRVDYARVRFAGEQVEPMAIAGASILSSTTRADGFVVVPADSEGFPAGSEVEVWLYDES